MSSKRSIIWKIPLDEFKSIIENSSSITECLQKIGLVNKGRNNITFLARVKEENISIDHIRKQAYKRSYIKKIPLEKILVENSNYKSSTLKKRLVENNLLENKCCECGQLPEWNGKPLVLELDHINGIRTDNRLENLRILCLHCHSQTETFRGKANKNKIYNSDKTKYYCLDCKAELYDNKALRCKNCSHIAQRKTERPSKEVLLFDVKNLGYSETGRKYGVSDNAIRKWLKSMCPQSSIAS